jgi:hypothetical protein
MTAKSEMVGDAEPELVSASLKRFESASHCQPSGTAASAVENAPVRSAQRASAMGQCR